MYFAMPFSITKFTVNNLKVKQCSTLMFCISCILVLRFYPGIFLKMKKRNERYVNEYIHLQVDRIVLHSLFKNKGMWFFSQQKPFGGQEISRAYTRIAYKFNSLIPLQYSIHEQPNFSFLNKESNQEKVLIIHRSK